MHSKLRKLLTPLFFSLALTGLASAQKSITVSDATKTGTDIVTIRYKEKGSNETKTLTVNVDIPKGTKASEKAKLVEAAIDAQGDSNVNTDIDTAKPSRIKIAGGNGATIKSADLTGASGERRDALASDDLGDEVFTCSLAGDLKAYDADGAAAILVLGTVRGEIEVDLTTVDTIAQAVDSLVQGLRDLGLAVTVNDDGSLQFPVDPELDQDAIFGNTDIGLTMTGSISTLDPIQLL